MSRCLSVAMTAVPKTNARPLPTATREGIAHHEQRRRHEERAAHPEEPEEDPDEQAEAHEHGR